jgi:hypothetical protein
LSLGGDKVKDVDVRLLYSHGPTAMQHHHLQGSVNCVKPGFTPGHLLCMQTEPNMSRMRYLSISDSKAFTMSVSCCVSYNGSRNALQLAAQYSESVELIRGLTQVDRFMAKNSKEFNLIKPVTALGFLCGRSHFTSFNEMFECLIATDSSIEVLNDGLLSSFRLYGRSSCADGQVQEVLAQVESLLKATSSFKSCNDCTTTVHGACWYLDGKSL